MGLNKVHGYAGVLYNEHGNYLPGFKEIQKKECKAFSVQRALHHPQINKPRYFAVI